MTAVLSPQIKTLFENTYKNYDESAPARQKMEYERAFGKNPSQSRCMQIAEGFYAYLSNKNVSIQEYELFAGKLQHNDVSASMPHRTDKTFDPSNYQDGVYDANLELEIKNCLSDRTDLNQQQISSLRSLLKGIQCGLYKRWPGGHIIGGYERVIKEGYQGIEERIRKELSANPVQTIRQEYHHAMLRVVDAAKKYISRYAAAAKAAALASKNPACKKNLLHIADACERISVNGAGSFFEAIQAVILMHEMLTIEQPCGSISLGRLDWLLEPFYLADLKKGVITIEEAKEMIEALWIKLASIRQGYQNVTIGGCDENGVYRENVLTRIMLMASKKLRFDQPSLSLRYNKSMSSQLWEEVLQLIESGGGFPNLFHDETVINSKVLSGVSIYDAYNYGIVGCVEPSVCQKECANTEELRINWAKVLELIMNDGKCMITGETFLLKEHKSMNSISSFKEFYQWYKSELLYTIDIGIMATELLDPAYVKRYPVPFLSCTMDGCIEKACDVYGGGTIYNLSSINHAAMANVVDSLLVIKEMVFELRLINLSDLREVLINNFIGYEDLQNFAKNKCGKFGNGCDEADKMMAELAQMVCEHVNGRLNYRGGVYQTGMYSVHDHAIMGLRTAALPDGRRSGAALSNSLSPVQGNDRSGPTAVIRSVTEFPHEMFGNGMVLDLKFTPSFFKNIYHRKVFRTLVNTYFDLGGMEIQFNVIDRETLIAAQAKPEQYRNLLVRVSGFSAYFVDLYKALQDEIINRTEHQDVV